jgi:hypothetical protein
MPRTRIVRRSCLPSTPAINLLWTNVLSP